MPTFDFQPFLEGGLDFLIALVIFVVGYFVARILSGIVRRLLKKTDIDNRFSEALTDPGEKPSFQIEDVVAKTVFWIAMLFVFVAALDRLGLSGISAPISSFLNQLTSDYLPRLGGAVILLLVAWVVATLLRFLVQKGFAMAKFDEKVAEFSGEEEAEVSFGESLATALFWFVFLLFLPAVLNALGVSSLADPIQGIFDQALAYVPNILGAAMLMLIGWFVARIIRKVVTNLLAALGVDKYGKRAGMDDDRALSAVVGNVLYIFILLTVIVSALDQLNIAAISGPATAMLNTIINIIPLLLGATIVLVVAYAIGKFVSNLVGDLLSNIGFDKLPEKLGLSWSGERSLSSLVASLTLTIIMVFAATSAAEILGSVFLVGLLNTFIAYLWKVILAMIILALGLYFANLAKKAIVSTETTNANMLGSLARIAIIIFSFTMGLRELGIADDIVNMAFGFTLGAIAIAAALAFGLGSREAAGREVERFIASMRDGDEG